MKIIWTDRSEKDLENLDKHIAERIIKKVEEASEFPEHYLSPLKGV
ncbi:MAG: type II toxin-antitoxin system RelE family toxin [Thermoplasmatota archaeon]